ncbi:NAD-dependent epimerase/dehydratase family protein [Solilutibacter silvestris]|uniref:NADH(P)-binding protein n=1 Tax=Solilutibacter silvestris TaxID=1645665 RepID=A0A2K1PXF7_9GAMM|nr:NAD(P)-dependent oxidoreductase [Lysobacter silvestris]PNS07470.1 NADH(P)-binding protein [Lysobacter silvestris]
MRILLTGATSQLGHAALPLLVAEGADVIALSRRSVAGGGAGVDWKVARLPDALPALPTLDGIVSFGPLDDLARWLATLADAPARIVVATSSMSAVSKRDASVPEDRAVAERLQRGEAMLQGECERLGMRWTILRPTMIYGVGRDRNLTPIVRRARRWRLFPYPRGTGLRQPVHAQDVANAAIAALHRDAAASRVIELGGGERLRVEDMFQRVRTSLGCRSLALPVSLRWMPIAARAVPRLRGALSRLEQDLVADNTVATELLGIHPRPFRPMPATWEASP